MWHREPGMPIDNNEQSPLKQFITDVEITLNKNRITLNKNRIRLFQQIQCRE